MGVGNYLVEGVSGTGKTSVRDELLGRGYHAIHGDRELAYQGDPQTGEPLEGRKHAHHIWDVGKVEARVGDHTHAMSFFCGGSRNFPRFIHLFDEVFVLEVDVDTLNRRLDSRNQNQRGKRPRERQLIARPHATREDVPNTGVIIDATAPLPRVVDEILSRRR